MKATLVRALYGLLSLFSAFLLVYVGMEHLHSCSRREEYRMAAYQARFGSDGTPPLDGAANGLSAKVEDGALVVTGDARGQYTLRGPVQRLGETVRANVRYEVESGEGQVTIAIVKRDGSEERSLGVSDANGIFTFFGDERSTGARETFSSTVGLERMGREGPTKGGVRDLGLTVGAPVEAAAAMLDEGAIAAHRMLWPAGTDIRLVVTLTATSSPFRAKIHAVSYETLPLEIGAFEERFPGKMIAPDRWFPAMADPSVADVLLVSGEGLTVHATTKRPTERPALRLFSPTGFARSFRFSADLEARVLKHGSLEIAFSGSGYLAMRKASVGLIDDPDHTGSVAAFANGDRSNDKYRPPKLLPLEKKSAHVELVHDADHGKVRAFVDGQEFFSDWFILRKGDLVHFEIAAVAPEPTNEVSGIAKNVKLEWLEQ